MTKNDLKALLALFAFVVAFVAIGVFFMAKIEQITGWNDHLAEIARTTVVIR